MDELDADGMRGCSKLAGWLAGCAPQLTCGQQKVPAAVLYQVGVNGSAVGVGRRGLA